jgi:predicted nuclease of predicted toxin-antitoxin system
LRFLVDACVPRPVLEPLRAAGHDIVETRTAGRDPGDEAILRWAVQEQRILLTADADFAVLALRHGLLHHGIIQLPQLAFPATKAILMGIVTGHSEAVLTRSVVIAKESRTRVLRVIRGRAGEATSTPPSPAQHPRSPPDRP